MDYAQVYCETPEKVLRSQLFQEIVDRFVDKLAAKGSSLFAFLRDGFPGADRDGIITRLVHIFRLLASHTSDEIIEIHPDYRAVLGNTEQMHEFVEELYNFWRRFERFIYMEAPRRESEVHSELHGAHFIKSNEDFKHRLLYVYRRVVEHLTGRTPHVYRQLPSGANMGMLVEKVDWQCPDIYAQLAGIPFIRLTLIEPPVIFYPVTNKRKGSFKEIHSVEEGILPLDQNEWFCFPAKVGDLTAYIFFHQDFMSLGLSLGNLFQIAPYTDVRGRKPDIMLVFGVEGANLQSNTVFYDDRENDMLVGFVRHSEEVDYFGYFKKMTLTLHNIAMLKRKRLPVHGAMVCIKLKDGSRANVVIVGDSGAGKSETLEAFRTLSEDHICELRIIFDDMGSLGVNDDGRVAGYGTEIGAFVRLDDLEAGYAYEEIDRSIFLNPDKVNARLVIPITRYNHLIKGYPVDFVLYANNYEQVDEDHPPIEFFGDVTEAMSVFRNGARLAKGTTDEKGLVHTYFANPFGAPQRKDMHEKQASAYFGRMFETGVKVGQIRTRLGIEGFGQEGPRTASLELFETIKRAGACDAK